MTTVQLSSEGINISLPQVWTNLNKEGGIAPCKLNTGATTGCLEVTHSLQVSYDLTWQSCFHGHPVTRKNCSLLSHLPSMLTSCAMLTTLIDILETSRICQRNPDHQFIPLQKERHEIFKDASGSSTVAYVDSRTALKKVRQFLKQSDTLCEGYREPGNVCWWTPWWPTASYARKNLWHQRNLRRLLFPGFVLGTATWCTIQEELQADEMAPTMIKWCIYLHHLSSSTYNTLRNSRCLRPPSDRTLRDYTHCISSKAGSQIWLVNSWWEKQKLERWRNGRST